jgi:YggT family protein
MNSLVFVVKTLTDLYLLAFLLRFIMQWVRADYRNPLAQLIFKVTNPLVVPARRIVPSAGSVDLPTLIVLFLLECAATWLLFAVVRIPDVPIGTLLFSSVLRLIGLTIWFYTVAIFVWVILSWFGDRSYNPMAAMLGDLVEPVLRPVRRLLPPVAGFDLSPVLVLILLQAVLIALRVPF